MMDLPCISFGIKIRIVETAQDQDKDNMTRYLETASKQETTNERKWQWTESGNSDSGTRLL